MAEEQDRAEQLDDDKFDGGFPPDKLLGAQAYGAAGAEPHAVESVAARAAREEPEEGAGPPSDDGRPMGTDVTDDVVQELEAPLDAEDAAMHVDQGIGTEPIDEVDAAGPVEVLEEPDPLDRPEEDPGASR
ncbi:MAG: hypothetical protein R2746_14420 [Acidimicrobiales bacterium]